MSFLKTSVSFEKKYQEKKMHCKYIWQTEILFQIVIWYSNFELKIFKWRKKNLHFSYYVLKLGCMLTLQSKIDWFGRCWWKENARDLLNKTRRAHSIAQRDIYFKLSTLHILQDKTMYNSDQCYNILFLNSFCLKNSRIFPTIPPTK